jgi:glycogen debranching enzyme
MTNIWSWDNYFGALALAKAQPDLAWDQLMFFADHQDASGAYPDYVNDQYASFSCLKPPIAYWAYAQIEGLNPQLTGREDRKMTFYEATKKNTQYWLTHRMTRYGLPAYYHGNDSGWDNSTFFHQGVPVITPDLGAILIYQCDGLAKLAQELGRGIEAEKWQKEADRLMDRLIHLLWREDLKRFSAVHVPSNGFITEGDTLQAYLPLLIAYRLPKAIVAELIRGLTDTKRFLSEYGLATESKKSKFYAYNGYWRGPIWAPSTYLMISALLGAGEVGFAEELRVKWLALVEKSGFYENFDPVTGEGLVDPSFAWTASVYLRLLNPLKS